MGNRTPYAQSQHDKMLKALAEEYERQGYTVRADHIGHPNGSPASVNGHIPDVSASKSSQFIIAEAETCDTVSDEDTRSQWQAFSSHSKSRFHIIVPKDCLNKAEAQASLWGITVDKWWHWG